uniref:DUF3553 domain-containing protein n=1 Tax=Panagrolaimus superbus TaxID=310955 RepID=A0A914YCK4_9BILA
MPHFGHYEKKKAAQSKELETRPQRSFAIGDIVWYFLTTEKWNPGVITGKVGNVIFTIEDVNSGKEINVHRNNLKHRQIE